MRRVTVKEGKQSGAARSVLRPACKALAVGVVVVDEVDEVISQVVATEDDQVAAVVLITDSHDEHKHAMKAKTIDSRIRDQGGSCLSSTLQSER